MRLEKAFQFFIDFYKLKGENLEFNWGIHNFLWYQEAELDERYKENIWFLKIFSTVWQSELPFSIFFSFLAELLWVLCHWGCLSRLEDSFLLYLQFSVSCCETRTCLRLGGVCMERCRKMGYTCFHSSSEKDLLSGSYWRLQRRTNMDTNTFNFFESKINLVYFFAVRDYLCG